MHIGVNIAEMCLQADFAYCQIWTAATEALYRPEHGDLETLRLKRKPKLQFVGRQADVVASGVVAGGSIEPHTPSRLQ